MGTDKEIADKEYELREEANKNALEVWSMPGKGKRIADHATSVAVRLGYVTEEQAKDLQYRSTVRTDERTNHYFSLPNGHSLVVAE